MPIKVRVPRPTLCCSTTRLWCPGAITVYGRTFQIVPLSCLLDGNWAVPLSLAATKGISVDFFYGYLDVSVHRVRLLHLCIQCRILSKLSGFPHSEIPG